MITYLPPKPVLEPVYIPQERTNVFGVYIVYNQIMPSKAQTISPANNHQLTPKVSEGEADKISTEDSQDNTNQLVEAQASEHKDRYYQNY